MHEFIAKKGLISQGNAQVSGSLVVRDGTYGSLYGTASYAINTTTASLALTASYIDTFITSSEAISASVADTASLSLELSRSDAVNENFPYWQDGKLTPSSNFTVSSGSNFHINTDIIPPPDVLAIPALTINQPDGDNYNLMRGYGSVNNYLQFALRNTSSLNLASADFIAESDVASETSSYVDLGINNSGFNYSGFPLFKPLDSYLYANGGDLWIGTDTQGKIVRFMVESVESSSVYIDVTGIHGSGSLEGTASFAITASNTVTASNAISASEITPGSSFYIVSGSSGVPPAYIETYDYSPVSPEYVPPFREGRMFYDYRHNSYAYYTQDSGFRLHPGKEVLVGVHNPYTSSMPRMAAVYISGSSDISQYRPDAYYAQADGTHTRNNVLGVVRSEIASGSYGYILVSGIQHRSKMDTDSEGHPILAGDKLWLSYQVAGGYTNVQPPDPYESVFLGYCSEQGALGSFISTPGAIPAAPLVYAGVTAFPTITNNNDGTITVSTSSVNMFPNADGSGTVRAYPVSQSVLTVTTGSNVSNYVYVDYNGGNPIYDISITNPINSLNTIGIAIVNAREVSLGNWDIDIFRGTTTGLALANKILNKDIRVYGFIRENGFALSQTGSLGVAVSEGVTWRGVTRTQSPAVDSISGGSEFYFWYHSGSNDWTFTETSSGSITNKYYDDGTGLAEMSSSYYNAAFVYRLIGTTDEFVYVLANGQYADLNTAQANSQPPGDIPSYISSIGFLVGRIIIQSGSTDFAAIDSAFTTTFIPTSVNNHNNLIGLQGGSANEFFHLTAAEYSGSGTGEFVRRFQPTMSLIKHLGATPGNIPYWTNEQTLTYTGSIRVVGGEHVTINSASFPDPSNPEALLVKQAHSESVNTIGAYSVVNNFSQIYNQNQSSGSDASTDICATSDSGSQYENYIDMGIGSSGYASSFWPWVKPLDGYLQTHGGDLWLATLTDKAIRFTFNNTASTDYADKTGFYLTGSLFGTASRAVTASLADKATDLIAIPTTAVSASWASSSVNADTASYIQVGNVDGYPAFADSSSYAGSASMAAALSSVPPAATSASWVSASVYIVAADTASFVTASNVHGTVTSAVSSSYALSASWAPAVPSVSSSYAETASYAVDADVAHTISFVPSAATSASWVSASAYIVNADTASHVAGNNVFGPVTDAVNAVSASYVPNLYPQQFLPSASWASASISASYAVLASDAISASYVPNLYPQIPQDTVPSASWVSASAFITTAQTASFVTASNVVGVVASASFATSASYLLNYAPTVSASWASESISASYALVADTANAISFVPVAATSASWISASATINTASYAQTASWTLNIPTVISASYASASTVAQTAVVATSASWASSSISSSFSTTTSYALGIPAIKSGIVAGGSFAGNPKTASIVFTTPFPNNNYSVVVTGEPSRTWTIQNKVSGSFQINANNNTAFATNVFWQAISTGEFYS